MIFTGFAPNIEVDDVIVNLTSLLPWNWHTLKKGPYQEKLTQEISSYFNRYSFLFDSGRTSLFELLKAYKFSKGSEIIIQAFTCSVVPHSIIRANLKPIYCDINNDYNLDQTKLTKLLTAKTKAIIVQHTFGIPANIRAIKDFCLKNNLILIEDLAHSLGNSYFDDLLGTFGDSAILSFGSDKPISCSRGGAVITQNPELAETLKQRLKETSFPNYTMVLKNLIQPIVFKIAKLFYWQTSFSPGKFILFLGKKIGLLPIVVTTNEKTAKGQLPTYQLANSLAKLAFNQWQKLPKFVAHRIELTKYYNQVFKQTITQSGLLFYPLKVAEQNKVIKTCKTKGIILGDWHSQVIEPKDASPSNCLYIANSCPQAEKLIKQIVTLPTHININKKAAQLIVKAIKETA